MTPLKIYLHGSTSLSWGIAPREPVTTSVALAIFGGGVATSAQLAVASFLVNLAVTAVTSWALAALTPKPDFSSLSSQGILVNAREPAAAQDFVYGQVRKGGIVTYYETTGTNNKFLHQIITLAGHEVEEIGDIYINDEVVTLDGDGLVTGDKWKSKIRVQKFDGTQTSEPADLLNESSQIDSNFVGNGIAYLYVRYQYDQDVFANGVPLVTAVVKGKKVFDPRTSTTAYSNNAALCLRDYLVSSHGLNDDDIDETVFSAAANICDEDVTLDGGGGTEPRYTMNGIVKSNTNHGDVLNRMVTSCAGTLFWGAGLWKLTPGAYSAPTKTLTLDDLRGPINLDTRTNLRDQFNTVQGTFNDAEQRWVTADYPPIKSTGFISEDGGVEQSLDFELPLTTSAATAQRLAKLTLFRGREQMTLSADFGLNAFDVEVGEIIALDIDRYGWSGKEFEVIGWKFGPSDEGDTRITMTLRETSEDAFDWNAEESAIIANNTSLLSYNDVPTLGIPANDIIPSIRIIREKITEVISLNITTGRPEAVDRVEVQFAEAGTNDWKALGSGALGRYELVDPEPGSYKFRARAINSFGYFGDYTESGSVQTAGSAVPPSDVEGFFYEVSGGTTTLEWEPVPDLDLSFYRIRHSVETTGATWANATTAVDKVPRPGTSVALPTRAGTYLIKAYDKTGIASQNATSVVVPADVVPTFAQSLTQVEHSAFAGTKTDCEVDGGNLQITDPFKVAQAISDAVDTIEPEKSLFLDTIIDGRPLGDINNDGSVTSADVTLIEQYQANTLSDGAEKDYIVDVLLPYLLANPETYADYIPPFSATYDFSTYIETHDATARRVRARVDALAFRLDESAGLFDDLPGFFDDLPGLFDDATGTAQFADTSLLFYISTTPDDPTGTPTWSPYRQFRAGEFYGRAFRFRVVLKSTSVNVTPAISELTAFVEYD